MASFHIWHPSYLSAPPAIEMFVTRGDAFALDRGSEGLVAEALRSVGASEPAERFTFEAMRTHYFSSYRDDSTAWEDRWNLAWRLRAHVSERSLLVAAPVWGYFDLESHDASARFDDLPDDRPEWPCLVLADATDEAMLERACALVSERFPGADVVTAEAFGRVPQLRCNLGVQPRAFYEEGAGPAEELLAALMDAGASVRFDETLARLRQES